MSGETTFVVEETSPVYNIRHRAFYFSKSIIELVSVTNYDRIYYSLFDQLLRAATSVGANLVEGSAGVSSRDYINYNAIALKSANETKYWLCLIKEANFSDKGKLDELIKEADEISKIIATIIINLKKRG
ncbi:MAG: four helix bundle protein [Chitinophagaceae bacterium]|nr:four helix bundle protein [Chitinophagaceae bacterium]